MEKQLTNGQLRKAIEKQGYCFYIGIGDDDELTVYQGVDLHEDTVEELVEADRAFMSDEAALSALKQVKQVLKKANKQ